MKKIILGTFFMLIAIFIVLMAGIILGWIRGEFFLPAIAAFCVLGIALTVLVRRSKTKGKLRKFLILTGISAAGFTIFSVMHNMFYAFSILSQNITMLKIFFDVLSVIFFFASLICPFVFLVGMAGSVVLLMKKM